MNKWLLVALLWGAAALNYLDRQVVFSVFPLLERDLGASAVQLGLLGTVFLWTYGLLSPFGGYVADRVGRVRVILASVVIWSIATWITGHVHSVGAMLWARALIGASEAFYLPAALALIADRHDTSSRSLATGLHQSGLYTGMVLGGAWGGWMGDTYGWRPIFTILGVAGCLYFGLMWATMRRDQTVSGPTAAPFFRALGGVLANASFRWLAVSFVAMSLTNWIVYTWMPLFLYERFHMTLGGAGFSATFYLQAASYVGVIVGGILADRWSRSTPRARIYIALAGLIGAAPFLALVSVAGSLAVLICALVAFGVGRGFYDCNTMPMVKETCGGTGSATGYGLLNMAGCLAGGTAVAAAGFLKAHLGLSTVFQAAAFMAALGALALTRIRASNGQPRHAD